jgi:hypothetical protein
MDFVVLNITLQEEDSAFSVVKKIAGELRKQAAERDKLKTLAITALEFIARVEAGGVRLRPEDKTMDEFEFVESLISDLISTIERLDERNTGVLLLIDEADKAPETARLGSICKLLLEDLSRRGREKLCIGLAGLPILIQRLRSSHESSPRLFKIMNLKPLEDIERIDVLEKGMTEACEKNGVPITITSEAKQFIATLSEGYPHFLQEFAHCAFDEDSDNVIDRSDVIDSLFKENGAFDQLGKKYFDHFYAASNSNASRTVLDVMADCPDEWIDRTTIISESGLKTGTVDSALRALRSRNIIIQSKMKRGGYRLPTTSFAVWIKARKRARTAIETERSSLFGHS